MQKTPQSLRITALFTLMEIQFLEFAFLSSLFDSNCYRYSHTNHRVVTCTDQTHHLNVSGYGRRTCELCIGMHTSHCICHTIGSRACCHVIGMQCTACAAAGSYGEVLLALLYACLLYTSRCV